MTRSGGLEPLRPVTERAAWRGFGNLTRNESAQWTRTRAMWLQPLLWPALLVAPMALPLVLMREMFETQANGAYASAHEMLFGLGGLAPAVGAIILLHGAIIGERQSGTAAWVLSKPASRSAFVLAKFLVHTLALLLVSVLWPGLLAYAVLSVENGAALPPARFAAGLGLLALNVAFYAALTIVLGAFARARGVVLAVGFALLVGGDLVLGALPWLAEVGPWLLGRMALVVADTGQLLTPWPVVAVTAWVVLFLVLAIWRVRREEF